MRSKIDEDENLKIYLTGEHDTFVPEDGSVELDEMTGREEECVKATGGRDRPDIGGIVDAVFRKGGEERVAVLVCGPVGMAGEVRRHVGRWVGKGRDVWFHDEGFGW